MPQWLGVDSDWNDVRRILTGMQVYKRVGAGHDPVTLDDDADNVLNIGTGDESQEIGLEDQTENTVFAGPTAAPAAKPDFRELVAADLGSLLPQPVAQGDMLLADATPEWGILTLGGAAGYALVTTAATAEWDQTPTWSGSHTHQADLILDDGTSDSPSLKFVGGHNDDTIEIFLNDSVTAGNSDLIVKLCATDSDSKFEITDSNGGVVTYVDAVGNFRLDGHGAIGDDASIDSTKVVVVEEVMSGVGENIGIDCFTIAEPAANFSGNWRGIIGTASLDTAQTQTDGLFMGVYGKAVIADGIAGTVIALHGGTFLTDVEDGAATVADGALMHTPFVDTGSLTTGHGIRILEGTVGAGSITTLYGLYIATIDAGGTNYSIYTGAGLVRLGDVINFAGAMGDSAKDPTTDAPADWVECQIAGATYYLPAYAAS